MIRTTDDVTIYFLAARGVMRPIVKIGITTYAIDRRIALIQALSPVKLELMASFVGTPSDERHIHNTFRQCHSHGEWFFAGMGLLKEIAKIKAGVIDRDGWDTSNKSFRHVRAGNKAAEAFPAIVAQRKADRALLASAQKSTLNNTHHAAEITA
jgi:hypothetical protein